MPTGNVVCMIFRVALITPTLCDKAAHLPNEAPWGQNRPKKIALDSSMIKHLVLV